MAIKNSRGPQGIQLEPGFERNNGMETPKLFFKVLIFEPKYGIIHNRRWGNDQIQEVSQYGCGIPLALDRDTARQYTPTGTLRMV